MTDKSNMLIIPKNYQPALDARYIDDAVKLIKYSFQMELAGILSLRRLAAPLFILSGTGINDDLSGTEPVTFEIPSIGKTVEFVQSLAKWKRMKLGDYGITPGAGVYVDVNAVRVDEKELDNLHSVHVDQWGWECTISEGERNLGFLKSIVNKIYGALQATEKMICSIFPGIRPWLSSDITFIHAEDLQKQYPDLSPRERETKAVTEHGSIFLIGIGGTLPDGTVHGRREPDYEDWTTRTGRGHKGLNGDIILWNPLLECAFELSSMGIRVDKSALSKQLKICGCEQRLQLLFHKSVMEDRVPLSIGGGIGQSRMCMFLLHCAHIGEIQSSVWPETMIEECMAHNIRLKQ